MVKIGMLLPEERMVEPARKIIEENHLDVVYLEAVHTVDAVNKASGFFILDITVSKTCC